MRENSDGQIALFVRDDKTGRRTFNAEALKVLGVNPTDAYDRGYPLAGVVEISVEVSSLRTKNKRPRARPESTIALGRTPTYCLTIS
jgi:hypothetical protein